MADNDIRTEVKIEGSWGDPKGLDVVFVDEMQYQEVEERCYITFGQVRLPSMAPRDLGSATAEIRPVVRVVMTKKTMLRMLAALSRGQAREGARTPEMELET